jgi:hypothetical protein
MAERALALVIAIAAVAAAEPRDPTPQLDAERDQLLNKITRGEDYDTSVRRFGAILDERDRAIATSEAARAKEHNDREARRAWQQADRKTADYDVSWRCGLAVDPTRPPPSRSHHWMADWGKVVNKVDWRTPPKNALDSGDQTTLYEVAGARRHYFIDGRAFAGDGSHHRDLIADVGDLVLVCDAGTRHNGSLPSPWREQQQQRGVAVRLAAPPRIVAKARWNPVHIPERSFWFWAIRNVRWDYPPEQPVLARVSVGKALGDGVWEAAEDNHRESWLMEVPAGVAHQELLVEGHDVWAILTGARFDPVRKKLVLTVEDLEARYIEERP